MLKRYCDITGTEITHEKFYRLSIEEVVIHPFDGEQAKPAMPDKEISPAAFIKIKEFVQSMTAQENHG